MSRHHPACFLRLSIQDFNYTAHSIFRRDKAHIFASVYAAHGNLSLAVPHSAGDLFFECNVHFACACCLKNRQHIVGPNAAARHDDDAILRKFHHLCYHRRAVHDRWLATGSEYTRCTCRNHVFQCFQQVARHIDCAMECNRQWLSEFHKLPCAFYVNRAIGPQQSEHDAVCSKFLCDSDIVLHRCKFRVRIQEVPTSRTDHHVDGDLRVLACCANCSCAGSGSAFQQVGAKLDALCTSAIGGDD